MTMAPSFTPTCLLSLCSCTELEGLFLVSNGPEPDDRAGAVDAAAANAATAGGACAGRVDAVAAGDATLPSQPSSSQRTAAAAAADVARSVGIGAWAESVFSVGTPLSAPVRLSCVRFSVHTA